MHFCHTFDNIYQTSVLINFLIAVEKTFCESSMIVPFVHIGGILVSHKMATSKWRRFVAFSEVVHSPTSELLPAMVS